MPTTTAATSRQKIGNLLSCCSLFDIVKLLLYTANNSSFTSTKPCCWLSCLTSYLTRRCQPSARHKPPGTHSKANLCRQDCELVRMPLDDALVHMTGLLPGDLFLYRVALNTPAGLFSAQLAARIVWRCCQQPKRSHINGDVYSAQLNSSASSPRAAGLQICQGCTEPLTCKRCKCTFASGDMVTTLVMK